LVYDVAATGLMRRRHAIRTQKRRLRCIYRTSRRCRAITLWLQRWCSAGGAAGGMWGTHIIWWRWCAPGKY